MKKIQLIITFLLLLAFISNAQPAKWEKFTRTTYEIPYTVNKQQPSWEKWRAEDDSKRVYEIKIDNKTHDTTFVINDTLKAIKMLWITLVENYKQKKRLGDKVDSLENLLQKRVLRRQIKITRKDIKAIQSVNQTGGQTAWFINN